ncbi:MAG: AsmA-like C-terminal domain-containing protein, partial [Proteobacteria bacterium]|nr:AsmA-like C-terminal domain-containing protein [Pseudomonadota bacterium]
MILSKAISKITITALNVVLIVFFLIFIGFFYLMISSPKSIPQLAVVAEYFIRKNIDDVDIKIKNVQLDLKSTGRILVRLEEVECRAIVKNTNIFIKFPYIESKASLSQLLFGSWRDILKDVRFSNNMQFHTSERSSDRIAQNKHHASQAKKMLQSKFPYFSHVIQHLNGLSFYVINDNKDALEISIQSIQLRKLSRNIQDKLILQLISKVRIENDEVFCSAIVNFTEREINLSFDMLNFPINYLIKDTDLSNLNITKNAEISIASKGEYLEDIVQRGKIEVRYYYDDANIELGPAKQKNDLLSGFYEYNASKKELYINELQALYANIKLKGQIEFLKDAFYSDFQIENFNVQDLKIIKDFISGETYNWLLNNLKGGLIDHIKLDLNSRNQSLNNDFNLQIDLKDAVLDMGISGGLPIIEAPYVKISMNKDYSANIDAQHAKILDSEISEFHAIIEKRNNDDLYVLTAKCTIEGLVKNLLQVGEIYAKHKIKNLQILRPKGRAYTNLNLVIPLSKKNQDIQFSINSNLKNFYAEKILKQYSVSNADVNLHLDEGSLLLTGKGIINKYIGSNVTVSRNFDGSYTDIELRAYEDVKDLRRANFQVPKFIKGKLRGDLKIKAFDNGNIKAKAIFDLKNSHIDLGFLDAINKNTTLSLLNADFTITSKNSDFIAIDHYYLVGNNISSFGRGDIDFIKREINIESNKTLFSQSKINFSYHSKKDDHYIDIQSHALDLHQSDLTKIINSNKNNEDEKSSINLNADFDRIILKGGGSLFDTKIKSSYKNNELDNFYLNGLFYNGQKLEASYQDSRIWIKSGDAGSTFTALGMNEELQGGAMELEGVFSSQNSNSDLIFSGNLKIDDYKVYNTSFFTKLVSLSSSAPRYVIKEMLQTDSVPFKNLSSKINFEKGSILSIEEFSMIGEIYRIYGIGFLDLLENNIEFAGTIIPVNALNSTADNIPLINKLLLGGKSN